MMLLVTVADCSSAPYVENVIIAPAGMTDDALPCFTSACKKAYFDLRKGNEIYKTFTESLQQ